MYTFDILHSIEKGTHGTISMKDNGISMGEYHRIVGDMIQRLCVAFMKVSCIDVSIYHIL